MQGHNFVIWIGRWNTIEGEEATLVQFHVTSETSLIMVKKEALFNRAAVDRADLDREAAAAGT